MLFSSQFNFAFNDQWHLLKKGVPCLVVYMAFLYFSLSFVLVAVLLKIIFLYHPVLKLPKSSFETYLADWNGRKWGVLAAVVYGLSRLCSSESTYKFLIHIYTMFLSLCRRILEAGRTYYCITKVFSSNQHNISSAYYGPTWRILRRNLTSEILHPSRIKSYSSARKWVLEIIIGRLKSASGEPVKVMDHFQYAMFCLLALMSFGDKLDEKQIKKIEEIQRKMLLRFGGLSILNLFPKLGKIIFRKKWNELLQLRQDQDNTLVPLIEARIEAKRRKQEGRDLEDDIVAYVDSLVDLQLPHEKRKLNMDEMVSICSEFLNAGTDTTATALQWIMANLVKFPEIQEKVYQETFQVVGETQLEEGFVKEEDLQKMPYLKAVILEALRRHPPGHFLLPHSVSEEVEFEGYVIPKDGTVNVMVADLGWDPNVWENPMEFKPERFLNSSNNVDDHDGFDITGSREIKMMPFGAGRRICPGFSLALLHLEYFVANLVWSFKWEAVDGDPNSIDLSEKQEFTVVMKNPLQARIFPRVQSA